jgi:hypothetical protein
MAEDKKKSSVLGTIATIAKWTSVITGGVVAGLYLADTEAGQKIKSGIDSGINWGKEKLHLGSAKSTSTEPTTQSQQGGAATL